jgi:hypothetical protein
LCILEAERHSLLASDRHDTLNDTGRKG